PDCIYATTQPNNVNSLGPNDVLRQRGRSKRKKSNSDSTNDIESESSSLWTNDAIGMRSIQNPIKNPDTVCACQLLWQLER
ncbi:unnamed protein product, partial [Rotaria magnacalcarata]